MSDNFLKNLLKYKGFSNDVKKEMLDREKALGLTLQMVNEMLPSLKKAIQAEERRAQKPTKTIIVPDDK